MYLDNSSEQILSGKINMLMLPLVLCPKCTHLFYYGENLNHYKPQHSIHYFIDDDADYDDYYYPLRPALVYQNLRKMARI
jgi:hypothetical protein